MNLRLTTLILTSALLTACGFKPMHAPASLSGTSGMYENVAVTSEGNDKIDFLIKQALRDRMGAQNNSLYTLNIDSKVQRRTLGISEDDVASRYDIALTTSYTLTERKTGDIVLRDRVSAVSTFASPRDPYGTISAEDNATEQVSSEAADRIIVRLATYFEKAGL